MNQQINDWKMNQEEKQKKENAEIVAVGLSALMGVNVVRKTDYDKINSEKQDLLDKVKDIDKIKFKLTRWVKLNDLNFDIINWSVKDKFIDILH